jgi:hypothetical protein
VGEGAFTEAATRFRGHGRRRPTPPVSRPLARLLARARRAYAVGSAPVRPRPPLRQRRRARRRQVQGEGEGAASTALTPGRRTTLAWRGSTRRRRQRPPPPPLPVAPGRRRQRGPRTRIRPYARRARETERDREKEKKRAAPEGASRGPRRCPPSPRRRRRPASLSSTFVGAATATAAATMATGQRGFAPPPAPRRSNRRALTTSQSAGQGNSIRRARAGALRRRGARRHPRGAGGPRPETRPLTLPPFRLVCHPLAAPSCPSLPRSSLLSRRAARRA